MRMHVVYLDEVSQVNLRILIEDTNEMNEMSMPLAILRRIMDTLKNTWVNPNGFPRKVPTLRTEYFRYAR